MAEVIVDQGYRPATILARADMPIRLVFWREDDDTCSERVIFSTPRLERRLVPHGVTTVDLPAQPRGEIRFTCGMGRYRGVIKLEPRPVSAMAKLRRQVRQLAPEVAIVAMAWLLAIPVLILLAIVGLDVAAAMVAVVVILVVVSIGSLWAMERIRRTTLTTMPDDTKRIVGKTPLRHRGPLARR